MTARPFESSTLHAGSLANPRMRGADASSIDAGGALTMTVTGPLVFAVTLNWNRWRDTVRCVESLRQQTGVRLELIVVDNGSVDDSVQQLRLHCPDVLLLCNQNNLGFGAGCNVGIREALARGADYIWLINNDAVASPDACFHLVQIAQRNPVIGQAGSVIHDFDHPETMLAWGGGKVNHWLGRAKHLVGTAKDDELHFVTAASTVIPRVVWESVGMFDEKFFLYWEDVDLSFRIRAAGYSLYVAPASKVLHAESSSLGKANPLLDYYYSRSSRVFLLKYGRFSWLSLVVGGALRLINRLRLAQFDRFNASLRGYLNKNYRT